MKPIERYILYVIAIAAILFFYFRKAVPVSMPNVTVLVQDTTTHYPQSVISNPVTVKPGEINIPPAQLTILQNTDTAILRSVLREMLTRYYEVRTQEITSTDDSVSITAVNTVTENKIVDSKLSYKLKFPVQHITNNPPLRNKVFAGIYLEAGVNGLYNVAPQIAFENKKGTLLSVNYNCYSLATGKDKFSFGVGVAQKISFRK